ncbi:helix-turn-helix domain-containing protein [Geminisphaera colitermitum]|uniref:helix-turn-helix domain-containing protein n=1 Tax=Geminisphaera colitermitum TaxID=1148786 RepID=UPI0001965598|nr:helix-turn-helix domain-containing protein [Geminisphaera colitermitum]
MKILIVDDPRSASPALVRAISADGHEVHRAGGGDCGAALKRLQEERYDLVLLTFSPDGVDRLDVIQRMLRAHGGTSGAGAEVLRLASCEAPEVVLGSLISLDEVERVHAGRVMARTSSLEEAARILGIDAATLYRKRKRWSGGRVS